MQLNRQNEGVKGLAPCGGLGAEPPRSTSLTFDATLEGFLSVVHAVYYDRLSPVSIQAEGREQLTLDTVPRFIETDEKKAARVYKAIREKISDEAAERVLYAFMAEHDGRFLPMLEYIRLGFSVGHMVDSHLHESFVRLVHKLEKQVGREAHLLYGFCRFEETETAWYCPVTPKNDVLQLLAQHFSQRLIDQSWVIHDKRRGKAAIYDGNTYVIVPAGDAEIVHTREEAETRELWVTFFNTLAIEERKNAKLQRQLLPLYFRHNMTEFRQ